VDDTIKDTKVLQGARAVLSKTFIQTPEAVPGMSDMYRTWSRQKDVAFHYVSNSPWQLYPMIRDFLTLNNFPTGSITLRQMGGFMERYDAMQGKSGAVERILADFPGRKFILVGDSGEMDLEMYEKVATKFPGQVLRIFIRDVTTPSILASLYSLDNTDMMDDMGHDETERVLVHTPSNLSTSSGDSPYLTPASTLPKSTSWYDSLPRAVSLTHRSESDGPSPTFYSTGVSNSITRINSTLSTRSTASLRLKKLQVKMDNSLQLFESRLSRVFTTQQGGVFSEAGELVHMTTSVWDT
jgi:hypothetical protein